MSVQSEITRLANAKTALATAIEGKGVTVPDGTKLDGMAALVESIEAGGGGSGAESGEWACGTYTPSETTTIGVSKYVTIETGLPSIRFFAFLYNQTVSTATAYEFIMDVWDYNGGDYHGYRLAHGSDMAISSLQAGSTINNQYVGHTMYADGGTMYFNGPSSKSKIVAGNTYVWFAIGR